MDNSVIKSKVFLSSLTKLPATRFFLFLGEEEGEKEKAIARIRTLYFGNEEGEFSIFHAENGELMKAASFLLSSSMFSKKKMAVIKGMGSSSKSTAEKEEEGATASRKNEASIASQIFGEDNFIVVFSTSSKTCPTALKKQLGLLQQVIFYPPFENDVSTYIAAELKKKGKTLSADSIRFVTSLVGRSYEKADDAIEKIEFGSDTGSPDIRDLRLLLSETREISVFEYIDALFAQKKNSFSLLKGVLDEGSHELQVLALVNRKLRETERTMPQEDVSYFYDILYKTEKALKSQKSISFLSNPLVAMTAAFLRISSEF